MASRTSGSQVGFSTSAGGLGQKLAVMRIVSAVQSTNLQWPFRPNCPYSIHQNRPKRPFALYALQIIANVRFLRTRTGAPPILSRFIESRPSTNSSFRLVSCLCQQQMVIDIVLGERCSERPYASFHNSLAECPYKTAKVRKIIHANGASHDLKFDRHAESAKIVIVFLGLELARTKYMGVTKAYI